MKFSKTCLFFIVASFSNLLLADSQEHHDHENEEQLFKEHSSHVHGKATAQISFENGALNIKNTFSAIDVFGFEHAPKNNEQKDNILQSVKYLEMAEKLFNFTGASCNSETTQIESALISADAESHEEHHDHADEHHNDHESDKDSHADVFAIYTFKCDSIDLNSIEYSVFDYFPTLNAMEIQYISSDQQTIFNATPDNRVQKLN